MESMVRLKRLVCFVCPEWKRLDGNCVNFFVSSHYTFELDFFAFESHSERTISTHVCFKTREETSLSESITVFSFDRRIASRGYHVYRNSSWKNAKAGQRVN